MALRLRTLSALAALLAFSQAYADQTLVKISAFPTASVSDGRSTIAVSAELRYSDGRLLPDGTPVSFSTTLGSFRESVVKSVGGVARATLVAGGIPGLAKVTATVESGGSVPTIFEYRFVGSKEELSSMREYIELVAPGYMQYANDSKTVAAAGPNRGVSLRYREIEIKADDLQLSIPTYTVRARKARLIIGKVERDFEELNIRLDERHGFGTTTFKTLRPDVIAPSDLGIVMLKEVSDGKFEIPKPEDRFGYVELDHDRIIPLTAPANQALFEFDDLSGSPSSVSAKKAVIFPRKEVQFQRAEIYVGNNKVMKMPLFVVGLYNTSELVTSEFVSVVDNQLSLNYPYYLSLKPGLTSLFRFRTGERVGRGSSSSRGAFLDYELNWNRGDDMDGGLTIGGIGRQDFSMAAKQYLRFDDRSNMFAQIEMPTTQSIFGSASVSRQFTGFQTSFNAGLTKSLNGINYQSSNFGFTAEKDPTKIGRLPMRLFYGLTASQSTNRFPLTVTNANGETTTSMTTQVQRAAGLTTRLQTDSLPLDKLSNINASITASKLYGSNVTSGVGVAATVTMSRRLSNAASVLFTYNYTHDGFNENYLGKHKLNAQFSYNKGKLGSSLFATKSLDKEQRSLYGDLRYDLSDKWRLSYFYTLDHYVGSSYLDYTYAFSYRIGWREVGLTWSYRTKRIGVQLLGASF